MNISKHYYIQNISLFLFIQKTKDVNDKQIVKTILLAFCLGCSQPRHSLAHNPLLNQYVTCYHGWEGYF